MKKFRDFGPSFQFKLRKETGLAIEYINYMHPIEKNKRWFYLSGVRHNPAETFKYWFIPVDSENRIDRFMNIIRILQNTEKLAAIAKDAAQSKHISITEKHIVSELMLTLTQQFITGGYELISTQIEQSTTESLRQNISDLNSAVLQHYLKQVYLNVLEQEGVDIQQPLNDFDSQFFEDAIIAINLAKHYHSPVFLELHRFNHIEATGLQITRSPGTYLVFPGCLLLALGVFFMFYMPQRRLWFLINHQNEQTSVLLAGSALRNRYDFDKEFEHIKQHLKLKLC